MNVPYKVLIADDSPQDQQITQFALKGSPYFEIVGYVNNGDQVIAYLNGWYHFAEREKFPLPDLLLLDREMPYRDGFEVLRWLKAHPREDLVTIMLSSSDCAEHVAKAYALGAKGYIMKPATVRDLQAMPDRICSVFTSARKPGQDGKTFDQANNTGAANADSGTFL